MIQPDINKMRIAGCAAAETLRAAGDLVRPGITTLDIDRFVHADTLRRGGYPAPLNYHGFPRSVCTSVNDVVCHGIPGPYVLKDGDIVNIDVTTVIDGHFGDTNATFIVGHVPDRVQQLVEVTRQSLDLALLAIKPGVRLGIVGKVIEEFVQQFGFDVVHEFGGHGIGRRFHDRPHVSHFGNGTDGPLLVPGLYLTIEPMVTLGSRHIILESDGWTVRTGDGEYSAQFEHTLVMTDTGCEVLTRV